MGTSYSEIFRGTIANLCSLNPERRVRFDEVLNWVDAYKDPILNKENFHIKDAPQKLHQEVNELRSRGYGLAKIQPPYQPPQVYSQINPQIQTEASKLSNIDSNVRQAESIYTPLPAQLRNEAESSKNIQSSNPDSPTKK